MEELLLKALTSSSGSGGSGSEKKQNWKTYRYGEGATAKKAKKFKKDPEFLEFMTKLKDLYKWLKEQPTMPGAYTVHTVCQMLECKDWKAVTELDAHVRDVTRGSTGMNPLLMAMLMGAMDQAKKDKDKGKKRERESREKCPDCAGPKKEHQIRCSECFEKFQNQRKADKEREVTEKLMKAMDAQPVDVNDTTIPALMKEENKGE
jgi:hypothetical protein